MSSNNNDPKKEVTDVLTDHLVDLLKSAVGNAGLLKQDLSNLTDTGRSMLSEKLRNDLLDSDSFLDGLSEKVAGRLDAKKKRTVMAWANRATSVLGWFITTLIALCAISDNVKRLVLQVLNASLG